MRPTTATTDETEEASYRQRRRQRQQQPQSSSSAAPPPRRKPFVGCLAVLAVAAVHLFHEVRFFERRQPYYGYRRQRGEDEPQAATKITATRTTRVVPSSPTSSSRTSTIGENGTADGSTDSSTLSSERADDDLDDDDDHLLPLCARDELAQYGRWEPVRYAEPPYVSKTVHLRCRRDDDREDASRPADYARTYGGYVTYDWRIRPERGNATTTAAGNASPSTSPTCRFHSWNSSDFCRLMSNGVVSIVGDSLSWEQYSSLLQLLGERVHQMDQHRSKNRNANHVQTACFRYNRRQVDGFGGGGGVRVVFRNDPRLEHVLDSIENDFPLVLVLNRGAHYVNDTELERGMSVLIEQLRVWQQACANLKLKCHLFWRTTVPGHPGCATTTTAAAGTAGSFSLQRPNNDLVQVERWIEDKSNYDNVTIEYHWYDFQHQNRLVERMLEGSRLEYTVLDAYYLNVRRPDGHRTREKDCLHNCYPGTMDVLNRLLLHFLARERTAADVERLRQQIQRALEKHGLLGAATDE